MNNRQAKILSAIIDEFIRTALPVGSHHILEAGSFELSGATIRNEMRVLTEEGFIAQPHTSAGRVPTVEGYRVYVREFMDPTVHERLVRSKFDLLQKQYFEHKDRERVYEAVSLLSHMVPSVSFATVPYREHVYYLGLANAMREPEFKENPAFVSGVVEVLENRLAAVLAQITLTNQIQYFIGEQNLCPGFESCSMLVTRSVVRGQEGAIGILGPTRLDYAYNTVVLDMVSALLRDS